MRLVIGLGNPGKEYEKTRHNVGFMALDKLADKLKIYDFKDKFNGLLGETTYKGEKILLLKPQTYMNLSGNSVIQVVNFYKLDPAKDIVVVYDDMSLPLGKLRVREKGSAGGHNGIKSLISHLGDKFLRIKVGIGQSQDKDKIVDFVIGKFSKEEEENISKVLVYTIDALISVLDGISNERIMQMYNKK